MKFINLSTAILALVVATLLVNRLHDGQIMMGFALGGVCMGSFALAVRGA